jgi:hypothetical protein
MTDPLGLQVKLFNSATTHIIHILTPLHILARIVYELAVKCTFTYLVVGLKSSFTRPKSFLVFFLTFHNSHIFCNQGKFTVDTSHVVWEDKFITRRLAKPSTQG